MVLIINRRGGERKRKRGAVKRERKREGSGVKNNNERS
jgi:hypothetical protein